MTTKFDELTFSIKQNSSIIHDLKSTIADLQNSNLALQSKQSQLENKNINANKQIQEIIELKRYSRRNNLEISNLPESEKEDLIQAMKNLQEAVGVSFVDKITALHRVPSFNKGKPKPIICQVASKSVRDNLLKKLRNSKLTATQINSRFPEMPLYFNEHLTPELKQLFFHARKYNIDQQFRFCWTRDGEI
ncbi:hypothetical protein JTE90_012225 [Oedothorax gibbosus]|uniref:Uncharacterized protein n=1 Tax=Oedothorax gibbosus TaxID=931172 RepID=A0AAV6UYK7_9ARAC|nr:hypothetical protein JTE90_012225 [Oedothorax gibbosus]